MTVCPGGWGGPGHIQLRMMFSEIVLVCFREILSNLTKLFLRNSFVTRRRRGPCVFLFLFSFPRCVTVLRLLVPLRGRALMRPLWSWGRIPHQVKQIIAFAFLMEKETRAEVEGGGAVGLKTQSHMPLTPPLRIHLDLSQMERHR